MLPRAVAVLSPALAVLAFASCAGSSGTQPQVSVSASPKLLPAFRRGVHDYVSRCARSGLDLKLSGRPGTRLRVDGHPTGRTATPHVPLAAGEATTISASSGSRQVAYRVRCLPTDFPRWTAHVRGRAQAAWFLTLPETLSPHGTYATIFDRHGVPVWWLKAPRQPFDAEWLPGHRVAWTQRREVELATQPHPYEVHALDGSNLGEIQGRGMATNFHELRPLANGNFLIVGMSPRDGVDLRRYGGPAKATVLDGVVQEVTPQGKVVWSWSSYGHIPLSASARWLGIAGIYDHETLPGGKPAYDLVHLNSAEPDGSNVVISSRYTDALFEIERSTGRIVWKLGGTHSSKSLKVLGDSRPQQLFGGQHDARVLADGTITVHDNATNWRRRPAAIRFRIDAARRTARVLERLTDPAIRFSGCCGSARKLPGGDWVVSWGFTKRVAEMTPSGRKLLEIDFRPGHSSYRAVPILQDELSGGVLRRAMDEMAARARGAR